MWLRKMSGIDPSVARDGLSANSRGQRAAAPTTATGLLAAVDIWSTDAATPAPAKIAADGATGKVLPRPEMAAGIEPVRAADSGAEPTCTRRKEPPLGFLLVRSARCHSDGTELRNVTRC